MQILKRRSDIAVTLVIDLYQRIKIHHEQMKPFYFNRLPHLAPLGGCFFVTYCTHDSIPMRQFIFRDKRPFMDEFVECDVVHDKNATGINITQSGIVDIIINSIRESDNILYELLYFCIMPNHVHLIFYTGNMDSPKPLGLIMKAIKGSSSRKINLFLNRTGTFWQKASYDRLVRDEKEVNYIADYILNNPVKAGLVKEWEDWPYTYAKIP